MFDDVGGKKGEGSSLWSALFDSDWQQRADIDDLSAKTSSISRRLGRDHASLTAEVKALEQRVAELTLFNRTLLAVLLDSGAITEEAFNDQLRAFDLEDGKLDGR